MKLTILAVDESRRRERTIVSARAVPRRAIGNCVTAALLAGLVTLTASAVEPARLAPAAAGQTQEVVHTGDAADDPAIWVHPTEPGLSVIYGTDKQGGLNVYSLSGELLQSVSNDTHPNNVDLLYDFPLAEERIDLALATTRAPGKRGVKIWCVDSQDGRLREIGPGPTFSCFGGTGPYGLCAYRSHVDDRRYVFVNNKQGQVEQYLLTGDKARREIAARCVRTFAVSSQTEGCVADAERGLLYLGEEEVGIWCFGAEPDDKRPGRLIARVGQQGLTSNVEGLTLYYGSEGKGYLIASSQGSNTFHVYERAGNNELAAVIDPVASDQIDDVSDTDGIDVVNCALGDRFPNGLFVVQDGRTASGHQNFKLYDWRQVAGNRLLVDRTRQPRRGP